MSQDLISPSAGGPGSEMDLFVASLDRFLIAGVKNEAVTIYFYPGAAVTYRVGNKLMKGPNPVLTPDHTMAAARAMLPAALLEHPGPDARQHFLTRVKNVNFSYSIQGVARFRVNLFRQRGSLALSIRIIPQEIPELRTYALPDDFITALRELKGGLYVIHGKARSGKSTLAAAVVDHINKGQSRMILVLEPTIQFSHKNNYSLVTQRELGADITSLLEGIVDAQQQDQDVIFLDELNDGVTFDKVMESVFKGITVFAMVATPDAEKTVNYLLSFRPPNRQLDLINDLMTMLKGLLNVNTITNSDGRRDVSVAYVPGNMVNSILLTRRTELEQKGGGSHSSMQDIDSTSSVDTSWFDSD